MRQLIKYFPLSACALATGLLITACGGGSASAPGAVNGSSGYAIDDYLSGATVFCDSNNNGSADAGETTVSTDSSGFFKFGAACSAQIVVTGGTNVDTGLPFTGKLKAPSGSTVVTPLTTLMAEGTSSEQVIKSLGLTAGMDILNTDSALKKDGALVNAELQKKTLAFQQLAQKTMEVFAGLATAGGNAARPAIYSEVLAAMAAEMRRGLVLVSGTNVDESVIGVLVKATVQRVRVSAVLSSEVKMGALGVNADSLGNVMAGGVKSQMEAILKSSNDTLTAVTKAMQSDMQIMTFVKDNQSQLMAAPTDASALLAKKLADQVTASLTGSVSPAVPVTPTVPVTLTPVTGTVLVSFDEVNPAFTGMGAYGGALPTVEAGPSGGAGNALKITKPAGQEIWGGTYFTVPAIGFSTDRKTITARVFSTRAGALLKFKVESANGGPAVEVESTVTGAANTWQTVTWNFADVDVTKSYTIAAITPDSALVTTGQSYYVDEIVLAAAVAVVTTPVTTDLCAAPNCVNFSASGIGFGLFENVDGTVAIVADPANTENKVVKFVKKATDRDYFGTTITGLGGSVVLTAAAKTVTMRVFSPAVGTNFLLKFEVGAGGPSTEKDVVTTQANVWETLTFVMPDTGTFSTVVLFPHGRSAVTADTIMYVDDLTFPAFTVAATTSGGTGVLTNGVFADDYTGDLPLAAKSTQGGSVGFYYDPRFDTTNSYTYGGVSGTAQDAAGVHNFYFGMGLNAPAITNGYLGAFVKSPGNGTSNLAAFANIKVNVWGPDQLFKAGAFPMLNVVLQGPAVAGCQSSSGASEIQNTFAATTQGAGSVYTLPLSGFTMKFACSGETTAAQVLAGIAQFNISLLNTNLQYINKDPNGVAHTNGLNIGSIKFN